MGSATGTAFGVLILATVLVIGVLRYGRLYPRIGQWLDGRLYAAFPRLGHLFTTDEERSNEDE